MMPYQKRKSLPRVTNAVGGIGEDNRPRNVMSNAQRRALGLPQDECLADYQGIRDDDVESGIDDSPKDNADVEGHDD